MDDDLLNSIEALYEEIEREEACYRNSLKSGMHASELSELENLIAGKKVELHNLEEMLLSVLSYKSHL